MLASLLLLLWLNLVPPVPLALAKGGIYHEVARVEDGYRLTFERRAWWWPWNRYDAVFRLREGDAVHCFTAVFAPTGLGLEVWHRWQQWDEARGWVDRDRIRYTMTGGRDGGFRGWTRKRNVGPGDWRVLVETPDGREIGRVGFRVVEGRGEPVLIDEMY